VPCLVCGAPSTVRSHILPRAFIHMLKGDEQRALVGHRHRDGREFTQSGSWDDSILCETRRIFGARNNIRESSGAWPGAADSGAGRPPMFARLPPSVLLACPDQ
jgi:hypothetical protein